MATTLKFLEAVPMRSGNEARDSTYSPFRNSFRGTDDFPFAAHCAFKGALSA